MEIILGKWIFFIIFSKIIICCWIGEMFFLSLFFVSENEVFYLVFFMVYIFLVLFLVVGILDVVSVILGFW